MALKNVTINEPFFRATFPHHPVMPGVLIVEAMAQAAAILSFKTFNRDSDSRTLYYFVGIDEARFKKPVMPGDRLILEVQIAPSARHLEVLCPGDGGETVVSEAELLCTSSVICPRVTRPDSELHDCHRIIHAHDSPTAIVHPGARLAPDVRSGRSPSSASMSRSAPARSIGPHTVITGRTRIGRGNRIFQFVSLGEIPQDKKYAGEPTVLEIGDGNTIREFCTFNIGTAQDVGVTRLGDDNWVMAYVHLAHDCQVGSHTMLANSVQLGRPRAVERPRDTRR